MLGYVNRWIEPKNDRIPVSEMPVTLRNRAGQVFTARTDRDGIYEFQHLPPGVYVPDSRLSANQYLRGSVVTVTEGFCTQLDMGLWNYSISGTVVPRANDYLSVKLVPVDRRLPSINADSVEDDGRFYFRSVALGEYLLSVSPASLLDAQNTNAYYPGTSDLNKATRIKIDGKQPSRSFGFDPNMLPILPILVKMESEEASRYNWSYRLSYANSVIMKEAGATEIDTEVVRFYGIRNSSYMLQLHGYSSDRENYGECLSEAVRVKAELGMPVTSLRVPTECR